MKTLSSLFILATIIGSVLITHAAHLRSAGHWKRSLDARRVELDSGSEATRKVIRDDTSITTGTTPAAAVTTPAGKTTGDTATAAVSPTTTAWPTDRHAEDPGRTPYDWSVKLYKLNNLNQQQPYSSGGNCRTSRS